MFEAKVELTGFEEAKKLVSSSLMKQILKYTAQDLATGARTRIKEKIQEGYNIRPSDLLAAMKTKAGVDSGEYFLQVKDADKRGIPIFQLAGRKAVQTREGTWAEIRKGRAKAFTHAFIGVMKSGHKGVFIRYRGGTSKSGRVGRSPIHEIYGPRITSLVSGRVVMETIQTWIKQNAQRIFEQKLNWKTRGWLGR
jgi:hypothetical protein